MNEILEIRDSVEKAGGDISSFLKEIKLKYGNNEIYKTYGLVLESLMNPQLQNYEDTKHLLASLTLRLRKIFSSASFTREEVDVIAYEAKFFFMMKQNAAFMEHLYFNLFFTLLIEQGFDLSESDMKLYLKSFDEKVRIAEEGESL